MNVRRGGLGRGLGALIPTGPMDEEVAGARFEELPIDSIEPNPRQPREVFDAEALAELVTSVREVGVLQPVVVREVEPTRYQLIMGERRWRACREAGLATIPAIVRDTTDDHLLRDALLENLHRQQLNPLEEAAAYQQLLQEFGATHDELADRIGRSRSQVTNMIRLLQLPPAVQRRVAAGVLSAGHARALLALPDPEAQDRLAGRIVAEGLSVRATEEIVTAPGDDGAPPVPRRRRQAAPGLRELADGLSDLLETRVTVDLGRSRGKVTVQFASLEDLRRIVGLFAPSLQPAVPGSSPEAGTGTDHPTEPSEHHEVHHEGQPDQVQHHDEVPAEQSDGQEPRPDDPHGEPAPDDSHHGGHTDQ